MQSKCHFNINDRRKEKEKKYRLDYIFYSFFIKMIEIESWWTASSTFIFFFVLFFLTYFVRQVRERLYGLLMGRFYVFCKRVCILPQKRTTKSYSSLILFFLFLTLLYFYNCLYSYCTEIYEEEKRKKRTDERRESSFDSSMYKLNSTAVTIISFFLLQQNKIK